MEVKERRSEEDWGKRENRKGLKKKIWKCAVGKEEF